MSDIVCLDTNILIYVDQEEDEHHVAAKALRDKALGGEISTCISPQILNELFANLANPRRVLQPLSPEDAMAEVEKYVRSHNIQKIYPGRNILQRVQSLFQAHPVKAQEIYDLFLAATMLENDVSKIYTFNTQDFEPFSEIEVLVPPASVSMNDDEDMEQNREN